MSGTVNLQTFKNSDITIVNLFSECITTVINLRGVNINFQILSNPVVLMRYLSIEESWLIFPYELSPVKSQPFNNWISDWHVSVFKNYLVISRENQTNTGFPN